MSLVVWIIAGLVAIIGGAAWSATRRVNEDEIPNWDSKERREILIRHQRSQGAA